MSVANVLALASLGLLVVLQMVGFAFWMGKLSERLLALSKRVDKIEESDKAEESGAHALELQMVRFETKLDHLSDSLAKQLEKLEPRIDGMSRQLAALTTQRRGAAPPLADASTLG